MKQRKVSERQAGSVQLIYYMMQCSDVVFLKCFLKACPQIAGRKSQTKRLEKPSMPEPPPKPVDSADYAAQLAYYQHCCNAKLKFDHDMAAYLAQVGTFGYGRVLGICFMYVYKHVSSYFLHACNFV